jgi:hypothetical protein
MSQAVAAREADGAEIEAASYAHECIFGGGHGYGRGDTLTDADEATCRSAVAEALTEYSERTDGDSDSEGLRNWIDRVASETIEGAQKHIDELAATSTATHYVDATGQHYLPECLQNLPHIIDGHVVAFASEFDGTNDAERNEIEAALAGLGWSHEYDDEGNLVAVEEQQ